MILYEKDFAKEGATIDVATKNTSFIYMHTLLKSMGISNNKFFLALYDTKLMGLDPHNLGENDTLEIRTRIANECFINPWYFIREVVRVPAQGQMGGIRYELNRANLALCWGFFNNTDTFLTMPRQLGKTITVAVLMAYVLYITGRNVNIGMFTRETKQRHENVARVKSIREALPQWLINHQIKDGDNKEGIAYKAHNTAYTTFTAQIDATTAEGQARGDSYAIEHWDEFSYYRYNYLSYPAATSACNAAQKQAQNSGLRCANIITTTAGRLASKHGAYAFKVRSACARFHERLYDLDSVSALHDMLKKNSVNHMLYMEFSYIQLGKDEVWFETVTRNKDVETIALDYLNIWLNTADNPVLTKELSDKLIAHRIEPITVTISDGLIHKWYVDTVKLKDKDFLNKPMIIGMDLSDNVGRDYTTLVMVDPTDMSVVCTIRCNQTNLTFVARAVLKLMLKFKRSILIPERNRSGGTMIDILINFLVSKKINVFQRIYNTAVQERGHGKDIDIYKEDPLHGVVRSKFGFTTSSGKRTFLYESVLAEAVKRNFARIFDHDIIDEVNGLTIRNGRVDHAVSGHDDTLIAYLLAAYFIFYGRNLYVYGIKNNEFLNSITADGDDIDPAEKELQLQYYKQKQELETQISKTNSDFVKNTLLHKLKDVTSRMKEGVIEVEAISVSQAVDPHVSVSSVFKQLAAPMSLAEYLPY